MLPLVLPMHSGHDIDRARDALQYIPPDLPRDEWVKVGMAAHAVGLQFDDFNAWSAAAGNYSERNARDTWRSFKPGKGVGKGTLFYIAKAKGWEWLTAGVAKGPNKAPAKDVEPPKPPRPGMSAAEVWGRCRPATVEHGYIATKKGSAAGLRVVPIGDSLTVAGQRMSGALVVPVLADGVPVSLQFIGTPEQSASWKAAGVAGKLNLPGASMAGMFIVGDLVAGGTAFVCEGIGQAWACWQATGCAAVVAFGWGRVRGVVSELRKRDASARLVLVPDVGKEQDAEAIAREVGGVSVPMPEGWPNNSDVNDLLQRDGADVLEALLMGPKDTEPKMPFDVVFADALPDEFTPPDELVEGVLTVGAGSVLYGDSNSGKTFFVIDMAAALARGVAWMGKRTQPGLVVYLAAESPASVMSRLQAYQRHHGVRVPNFAIVRNPIDLFDGEADTDKLIETVRLVEARTGQRAALIVGDTLARLSAGANENAGQDMGLVVRRFDRIRTECKAHFLLVHHSGKAAAAGARGWSGIRAAMDTEIEVSDSAAGRCAEITKQRDLGTKGQRIGFTLPSVTLGLTKWGAPATSCVVTPSDAPEKPAGKRISEVGGAILEMLRTKGSGMKKREVVSHFDGRYDSSAVYRELKRLVETGQVNECIGIVAIAGGAKGAN